MVELKEGRIWIDGCFDFAHHGHAGAMMQARQNGDELYVGVHNDADILLNKGPPVMNLNERMTAVEGCKWCTLAIPNAPYVTDPKVMDSYGCKYVVHGDDITTDKDGKDCYAEVKKMGRFIVVKRTPNISTTDLVGRMLVNSTNHHMKSITENDWNKYIKNELKNQDEKETIFASSNIERYEKYATCSDAKNPGDFVWIWSNENKLHELVKGCEIFSNSIKNVKNVYYIDGSFDLFNPGHITLLKKIQELAIEDNNSMVVVGIYDDFTVNKIKGKNYPIMNILERSLCVLQSKYVDSIILGVPPIVDENFIKTFENFTGHHIKKVIHGITPITNLSHYEYPKSIGIFEEVKTGCYEDMNVEKIVARIVANRAAFEERQRRKGWKSEQEKVLEEQEKVKNSEIK